MSMFNLKNRSIIKFLLLSIFLFNFNNYLKAENELTKNQINEISRKIFDSLIKNEDIKLESKIESEDLKEFELSLKINIFRVKLHQLIKTEIKLEHFDQLSICDDILIDNVLLMNSTRPFVLSLIYCKINGEYKLHSLFSSSIGPTVYKILTASIKLDKDFVEPEILKDKLPKISNQTVDKLFNFEDKNKIATEELLVDSKTEVNQNVTFKFIGGVKISDSLNSSYYLIRKGKDYLFLRLTYYDLNNKSGIIETTTFNGHQTILETFGVKGRPK